MAEPKVRNAFSRSKILTVGRLLAFVVVGFTVGLVIGIASEEPELLAGHARGDTETVELDAALAARPDPDEAAALAAAASDAAADAARIELLEIAQDDDPLVELPDVGAGPADEASSGRTGGSRALVAGTAGAERWAIQVGAFADQPSAEQLARRLEGKGYPIEVLPAGAASSRWRVRVQPIDGESTARSMAERVEREERLPIWVIRLEESSRP